MIEFCICPTIKRGESCHPYFATHDTNLYQKRRKVNGGRSLGELARNIEDGRQILSTRVRGISRRSLRGGKLRRPRTFMPSFLHSPQMGSEADLHDRNDNRRTPPGLATSDHLRLVWHAALMHVVCVSMPQKIRCGQRAALVLMTPSLGPIGMDDSITVGCGSGAPVWATFHHTIPAAMTAAISASTASKIHIAVLNSESTDFFGAWRAGGPLLAGRSPRVSGRAGRTTAGALTGSAPA